MTKVFELNLIDYLNFKRMQIKNPKIFGRAGGNVLNASAFGIRKLAIRNIKQQSIVRNSRFIESSIRVEKARITRPLINQQSIVGSIKRKHFSGWLEQESGQQITRKVRTHLPARADDIRKQIKGLARLRNVKRFPKPSDFRGSNDIQQAHNMINILSRSGFTKPFLILGLEKRSEKPVPPGLYQFGSGKHPHRQIQLLRRFKKPKKTRRNPWLSPAVRQYISRVNLRTVWGRAVTHELRKTGIKI